MLRKLGWLVLISTAVVAIFAASFFVAMRLAFVSREVSVPDLAGMPLEEARAVLNRSDLYLETSAERYDDRIQKGHVQSQDPPAGATIKKNRKVRVIMSLGPLEVSIPDVRGQSLRSAKIALQREGLGVGHVTSTHEPDALASAVMAQHPLPSGEEAGATGASGGSDGKAKVDLLVSRGRRDPVYVMPNLAHRRLEEVTAFARRVGLRVGSVRRESAPGEARGRVVRQYPQAGHPVGRQDIINVVLSE